MPEATRTVEEPQGPQANTRPTPDDSYFDSDPVEPSQPGPTTAAASQEGGGTEATPQPAERPRDAAGRFLPAETPAEPAPTKSAHSARVLRRAADLGISQSTIDASSPEALREIVDDLYDREVERLRADYRLTAAHDAARDSAGSGPANPAPAGPGTAPSSNPQPTDLFGGVRLDDFDPDLVAAITNAVKPLHEKVHALEQKLAGYEQAEQMRAAATFAERMDARFAADSHFFGTGTVREVKKDSTEAHRRLALVDTMRRLPGTEEQRYAKAKEILGVPAKAAEPPPAEANGKSRITKEQWNAAATARPTQRDGATEERGVLAAKKEFASQAREKHGINVSVNSDEDEEF